MFLKFHEDSEEKRQVFGLEKVGRWDEERAQRWWDQRQVLWRTAATRTKAVAPDIKDNPECVCAAAVEIKISNSTRLHLFAHL